MLGFSLGIFMKLELFYYEQCPFCMFVLRKIQSLGLEEKIELKNTLTSRENQEYHVAQTGRSTVPCLYINDQPLFESADIMEWLEDNKDAV
jgi:glutaredoxin